MNASFFYIAIACIGCTFGVLSQQMNDGNYSPEADIDYYQDYQLVPKAASKTTPFRSAKPRSPVINAASQQSKVTPVPILKQINRHNEDGSYTYGFEGADGSFKIETKLASGEVIGKYGYVDDGGKVRIVEYGANKYGFQPVGEGITIPPITITNDTESDRFDEEEPEYVSTPPIKTQPKSVPLKRKPSKVSFYIPEQRIKPQSYVVQAVGDSLMPITKPQSKPITPNDINSLQALFGNDIRDSFPYRPETPLRKIAHPLKPEENSRDDISLQPFSTGLPIPNIFEGPQAPHFQVPQNEFFQSQFEQKPMHAVKASPKLKSKPKPQLLFVTPIEDGPQFNAVRRNSSPSQDRSSILDELLKQYAIPNGSPAINDYSFSYYN